MLDQFNRLQIVIPMTGNGSRFKASGYSRLKPFIDVHGKPMIEWVTRMFADGDNDVLFICRNDHLRDLKYTRDTLEKIDPFAKILGIQDWKKLGPVNDVLLAAHHIDDDRPVLVSYCDFFMHWDFEEFFNKVTAEGFEGAVPCYTGFHPHLIIKDNLYASCNVDEANFLIEIREKFSWTADKTYSLHSPGVYYFKTGRLMKIYFQKLVQSKKTINGEYYVSVVYNQMVQDGLRVWCPPNVKHFCQWGTPQDLEEYLFWVDNILRLKAQNR